MTDLSQWQTTTHRWDRDVDLQHLGEVRGPDKLTETDLAAFGSLQIRVIA